MTQYITNTTNLHPHQQEYARIEKNGRILARIQNNGKVYLFKKIQEEELRQIRLFTRQKEGIDRAIARTVYLFDVTEGQIVLSETALTKREYQMLCANN